VALVEALWLELLIKPLVKAHCAHALKIARPQTKREAVERMENAFVSLQLTRGILRPEVIVRLWRGGICRLLRAEDGSGQTECETKEGGQETVQRFHRQGSWLKTNWQMLARHRSPEEALNKCETPENLLSRVETGRGKRSNS
jgi:hypothetical protein